jgi:hypothetical protein
MAGHRRRAGRVRTAERRAGNQRRTLTDQLAAATTPSARVAAAAAHLRGVLAHASPAAATTAADRAVRALTEIADTVLREKP